MQKKQFIEHWNNLTPNQRINPTIVPYKHEGTTFAEDGIRLTGTTQFIDSVLSRLKDLLQHENAETRLQVNYTESKDRITQRPTGSYVCYVQVHERGGEAKMVNAMVSAMTGRETIASRGW
jgi:hypothetical protein